MVFECNTEKQSDSILCYLLMENSRDKGNFSPGDFCLCDSLACFSLILRSGVFLCISLDFVETYLSLEGSVGPFCRVSDVTSSVSRLIFGRSFTSYLSCVWVMYKNVFIAL